MIDRHAAHPHVTCHGSLGRRWSTCWVGLSWLLLWGSPCLGAENTEPMWRMAEIEQHVPVYDIDGRFGGWPANHGIWSWGNEILCGFSAGYYQDLGPDRHAIDRDKPEEHLLARSLDGGQTWNIENPAAQGVLLGNRGMRHGTVPPGYQEADPIDNSTPINFQHPDLALTFRMSGVHGGESRWYVSYDRGHHWQGPYRLPALGQVGIAARTDYLIDGPDTCTVMLTVSKQNAREGRIICARTTDGGRTWAWVGDVGPEPTGYAIMPATVRLGPQELLCTRRMRTGEDEPFRSWIDAYRSRDNGRTWEWASEPVPTAGEGNPPSLIRLMDGRLCLTYGYRAKPFAMLARFSRDGGATWGPVWKLRDDGAGRDIGYPRSIQRPDGTIVTLYYIHDTTDVDRKIVATLWHPGD